MPAKMHAAAVSLARARRAPPRFAPEPLNGVDAPTAAKTQKLRSAGRSVWAPRVNEIAFVADESKIDAPQRESARETFRVATSAVPISRAISRAAASPCSAVSLKRPLETLVSSPASTPAGEASKETAASSMTSSSASTIRKASSTPTPIMITMTCYDERAMGRDYDALGDRAGNRRGYQQCEQLSGWLRLVPRGIRGAVSQC